MTRSDEPLHSVTCPGLPGNWINGWLAAVGATVLDPRIRLHWSRGHTPVAVLSSADTDPVEALSECWPTHDDLWELPIAEKWRGAGCLGRRVPVGEFVTRAAAARRHLRSWALSSTLTDLSLDDKGDVGHGRFDPPGPGTVKWLHYRLVKVHRQVEPSVARIRDSLAGRGERVKDNGLGFDATRVGSLSDDTDRWVEPLVETMAFFGLAILPVRGDGTDRRSDRRAPEPIQRGWTKVPERKGERSFAWPVWDPPLDWTAIDALMDAWTPFRNRKWSLFGVHAGWRTVPFRNRDSSDPTRAFASLRL